MNKPDFSYSYRTANEGDKVVVYEQRIVNNKVVEETVYGTYDTSAEAYDAIQFQIYVNRQSRLGR